VTCPMVKWVTDQIDFFFDLISGSQQDGQNGHNSLIKLQLLSLMVNACLSLWPLSCLLAYRNNIHVLFWMGRSPQRVNIITPFAFFGGDIGMHFVAFLKVRPRTAKHWCFVLYLLNGSLLVGCGLYVAKLSYEVSQELSVTCGSGVLSGKIENEWQRLAAFHDKCVKELDREDIFIQACPGFDVQFPKDHRVYVDYIADMEEDYECQGFCQFWSQPFFNTESTGGSRCASAVGLKMEEIGWMVGFITMVNGAMVTMKGVVLTLYDHL